jgi:tRNA(Ile)-lysidine synthase
VSLHPSVAAVRSAVRRGLAGARPGETEPGDTVLVACSGGPDSLALLAATVFEGHKLALRVVGVTVDHGLQDGSAELALDVVARMARLGADETATARVRVEGGGRGVEAAAREARYAVLAEMADHFRAGLVLLGHTLDDQAETVLLGLARGSGARSLAGMRPGFDRFRRPLLDVRRVDTVTACRVEGIEFWRDPHNADAKFTRARVRERVLPVLEAELGPGVAEALARTADQLRDDSDLLDELADAAYAEAADPTDPGNLLLGPLLVQPRAVRTRVLRRAALAAGSPATDLFRVHVLALADLATGPRGRTVQLPGLVTAHRDDDRLRFEPTAVES